MTKEFRYFFYLILDSSVVTSCTKTDNDITQRLKIVPSYIITSYLAGDYFQVLRNIIAPAALMVRQQSSLIITPEWEYSS